MTDTLLAAVGLMLVLEGILPLLAPAAWRDTFSRMLSFSDGQLRFVGLLSLGGGCLLLLLSGPGSA